MYLFVGSPSSESKSYHQVQVFPGRTWTSNVIILTTSVLYVRVLFPVPIYNGLFRRGPEFVRNTGILIWSCHGLLLRIPGKVLIFSGAMVSSPFCVVTFSFTEHLGCTVEVIARLLLLGLVFPFQGSVPSRLYPRLP